MLARLLIALCVVVALAGCGKSKEQLYAQGLEKMKDNDPGAAVVLFKSALEKDQNYTDARFQLAKAFSAQGKNEVAEKEFLKVLVQSPQKEEVNLELAKIYTATNRVDEAFKLAEAYQAKHPGDATSLEVLGIASAVRQMYPEAERYLLSAIQADANNHAFKLELAKVYVAQKQNQKARETLEGIIKLDAKNMKAWYMLAALSQFEGNSAEALATYTKIVQIKPSETNALYRSGLIYLQQRNLDKADALADGMIKDFPKRSDGYRLKGLVQYNRRQYAEAGASLQKAASIAPTLETYYYLGLSAYSRGEFENALSHFRKILDNSPNARQARLMTATVLMAQKRTDDAISELVKLTKENEQDAEAFSLLGSAYMAKGMFDEGMQALNTSIRINPKSTDTHIKKGSYYLSIGKTGEGESEFLAAVHNAPDKLSNRLLLASTYIRSKKLQKAFDVLKAGLSNSKADAPLYSGMATVMFLQNKQSEGISYLQKAKEVEKTFVPAYQRLATYYVMTGKNDLAIQEYKTLLSHVPDNLQVMLQLAALLEIAGKDADAQSQYKQAKSSKKALAFIAEAQYLTRKKQPDTALSVLTEAQRLEPKNAAIFEQKAQVLAGQKKFKDVLKVADELAPVNADAAIALKVNAYMALKQSDKALEQARKVIEKYPRSSRGYELLATIYEYDRKYPEAINEVKKALQINPSDLKVRLYLGNLQAASKDNTAAFATYAEILKSKQYAPAIFAQGALLQQTGKTKEAIERYRACIAIAEDYVPVLNNLSYLYAEGYGSKQEALNLALRAFRLASGNPGVLDTLGYALLANGKYDDARKVLEKATAMLPDQPSMQYHLALAYKQTGNRQGAVTALNKALQAKVFPEADAARKLLAEVNR